MKHFTQTTANGLHTPPCGSSQSKSTRFSLLTSLMLFVLLFVGSNAAWAADGYYAVHGNNWQGTNGDQWNDNNNKARMSHQADGVYWCDKVAVSNGTTILFKILYGSGYDGSGFDWSNQKDATLIDNSRGNATLLNDNSDNRIQYTATENVDLYIYTNGSAIWANAVKQGSSSLSGKTIRLQGDLWTLATSGDWALNDCSPTLQVSPAGEKATTAFYIPAGMNDKYTKARWETMVNGTKTNYNEARFIGCSDDGSSNAKIIAKIQNSTSCVKYVKVEYTSVRTTVTVTDAPAMTGNWYLWIDKVYKGQFVDGKIDIEDFPIGDGLHSIFVTNRTESQIGEYKNKTVKDHFAQGIEWLGGLYIDTDHSDVTTWKKGRYYKDASNYTKFSNREDFALINGGTDYNDARGGFQYNTVANVRFTLNNGVITINTFTPEPSPEPTTTYTVTLHPNNGGDNIVRNNVPEGSNSSASALNLSDIHYGAGTATWYTNPECTAPFSTVTGNMDLYAKWGVSGNYYVAGSLWLQDNQTSGDWYNERAKLMTYPNNGSFGTASVTYVGHRGKNVIEIIKNKDWGQSQRDLDSSSPVALSIENNHIVFTLSEAKQVTVSYNGKVSVSTSDVALGDYTDWRIKTNGWGGQAEWSHDLTLESDGTHIFRDVPAGNNRQFTVTKGFDDMANVGINVFHALYINTTIPTQPSALTWTMQTAKLDANAITIQAPQSDNFWRNGVFSLSEQSDLKLTFDGGNISIDVLPKYTVSFNSNGGSEVASQTMFEGRTASKPADPTRDGYEFDSWRIGSVEGDEYDFDSPVSSNVSLVAKWNQIITHTVSFNMDGGIPVLADVVVNEGNPVAQPADPTKSGYNFVEWQLSGSTYNFESPVMGDIELVAVWSFEAIESVNLNKSTLILYENSDPQTLTPSYLPADVLGVTYDWNVTPAGVVTVVNGVVNVVAPGTATITCTATDAESNSQNATCSVTVYEGEGCEMEEQSIFSHVIFGNSTTGGYASNNLLGQAALNPGMESTCRTIKMYYNGLTSEFTADEAGVVKAKSGLSDNSDVWYEIKGGTNANSYDGNFYYLKNVATGGYITRGDGIYGGNDDWKFYTTITTSTNAKTNLYQFIYTKKDNQDSQKRICSVWNFNGTGSNQTYGLHRRNQDWGDNYGDNCPNPMIVFGRGVNQGNSTINANFVVVATGVTNPDYLITPIVYDTRSYYRFSADAAVSLTLDKKLRAEDKVVVYCYNPSNAASNGALYINNNKVSDIQIAANSAVAFEYVTVEGDAGYNTIEVKSDDNNFCVASIDVLRSLPVIEQDPQLIWSAPATYYTTVAAGNFTFEASSAKSSLGAIAYTSSDETVATVANGVVTPVAEGTAHITASIEQYNCFGESSISYDVVVELPLQDAIDANSSLTLLHDYAEDAVINKAITINGAGHAIGNLTVQTAGDLTLSGALTVNDFSIYAQAGNTTTPAASGQVRNAANLTANGNAYFYYTVDPSGTVHYGWYDFTVPFRVNVMTGIAGIENEVLNEDFVNERNYAIMEHLGDKQAAGQYAYKKFRGIMEPCRLYSITLDDDYNYNTIRFKKADGALAAGNEVTLNAYAGEAKHANWNGVGNGTLHHADVEVSTVGYIQVYQSGDKTFLPVDRGQYSLVVGSAFMIQQAGTMTLNQASHDKLLAPRRAANAQPTAIQIASEGKPFSDQLFISADEMAGQSYTQGVDVAKAGNIGNVNVPQIWTNTYNTSLCAHEAQLIDGEAQYTLSLYAPANGTYTLTSKNIPEGYTLYLTQNGNKLWDMSDTYVLDLTKGTTTEYGLLLVENYKMPTAVDNIFSNTDETTKIMRNGILYILQNGKVFNAQGARVK